MASIGITSQWRLVRAAGSIRFVKNLAGTSVGPESHITAYPSWGPLPARVVVRRLLAKDKKRKDAMTLEQKQMVAEFCGIEDRKTHQLHARVSPHHLARYKKAAEIEGVSTSKWVVSACNYKLKTVVPK